MCVLWTCYRNLPPEEDIRAGFELNSDGAGIAWFETKTRVKWIKGLKTVEELLAALDGKPLPLIIHCRMASAGGSDLRLTHPFPINTSAAPLSLQGEAKSVIAHNGHWGDWETELKRAIYQSNTGLKLPEGPWSDTRAMAWLTAHFGPGMLSLFPGKLAVMKNGEIYCYGGNWWHDDYEKYGYFQSSSVTKYSTYTGSYDTRGDVWNSKRCSVDTKKDSLPTVEAVAARTKRQLKGTQPVEIVTDAEMTRILEDLGDATGFAIELE
jgi:hypothetical protein